METKRAGKEIEDRGEERIQRCREKREIGKIEERKERLRTRQEGEGGERQRERKST